MFRIIFFSLFHFVQLFKLSLRSINGLKAHNKSTLNGNFFPFSSKKIKESKIEKSNVQWLFYISHILIDSNQFIPLHENKQQITN